MESEVDEETVQHKQVSEINLEYPEYEDNFETITVSSPHILGTGAVKGKYYKQTYRAAWEHMPDFKGWLTGVQGEPTRAYCLYCQKTLHAHRLSLLKHTCTIRHQKAAQLHNTRKNKTVIMERQITFVEGSSSNQDNPDGDEEAMVEYSTIEVEEHGNDVNHDDDGDEDDEAVALETLPVHLQKTAVIWRIPAILQGSNVNSLLLLTQDYHYTQIRSQIAPMSLIKPPISTHVLDTTKGHPVSGLQVSLYKLIDGRWTYINEGITNTDGRFANFLERTDFTPGRYKLHYDVDRYFEVRKQDSLYPFIEIVFDCRSQSDNYHVPLLLSPYGYTTYRGS